MYVFIGGTPAAGKSYTAKKFIESSELEIEYVEIDTYRKDFAKNKELDYWVKFFSSMNELDYWQTVEKEDHLANLIAQSEAFWPEIIKIVDGVKKDHEHAIFEAVNILPHLAHKDFDFSGCFLIEEDLPTLKKRLAARPRWGQNEELQGLEAKYFIEWEGKFIKDEARKYNYPIFNNTEALNSFLVDTFK